MRDYTFFVRVETGAFGKPQHCRLEDDALALEHGQLLATRHGACDIWRGARRIAFVGFVTDAAAPSRSQGR